MKRSHLSVFSCFSSFSVASQTKANGASATAIKKAVGVGILASVLTQPAIAEPIDFVQFLVDGYNGVDNIKCSNDLAITRDLQFAYSISFCDKAINIFSRDTDTGELTILDTIVGEVGSGESGVGIHPVNNIVISPDDQYVFVSGWTGTPSGGEHGKYRSAIFVYERDMLTGALTEKQIYDDFGLQGARMALSNDGNYLYVTSQNDRAVTVLRVAPNGILSEVQQLMAYSENYRYAMGLTLSPDNQYLVLGVGGDHQRNGIAVYARNDISGEISFITEIDSADFDDYVLGTTDVLGISNDNQHIYATGSSDITALSFDGATLNFEAKLDATSSARIFGLDTFNISANNKLAYTVDVAGLHVWGHSDQTHMLVDFGVAEEGEDGVPDYSISQSGQATISPDGLFLYVPVISGITVFNISSDNDIESDVPLSVSNGATFSVTYQVQNAGPATAHNTHLTIDTSGFVLAGLEAATPTTQCEQLEAVVTCTMTPLVSQALEEISITLIAPETSGAMMLSATVDQDEVDSQTENNMRSDTIVVMPETSQYEDQVQQMYVAYYGRPGDPAGIAYWADQLAAVNGNLSDIIEAFGTSDEFTARFGTLDNQTLVNNVYQQLFGRDADPAGLAFYVGELEAGTMSLSSIALNVSSGAQPGSGDYEIASTKLSLSNYFTSQVELNGSTYDLDMIADLQLILSAASDPSELPELLSSIDQILAD
ncbi:hypothetical protein OLMES_4049 [Oleiphilus messinensis]|uniref:DUF4214 domain-containing protein n=1 Tax=Oleiphilus messinensis TaxID=141451 RepID=A0A1Y0IC21_9GAMM|nr:DUF4214 domain-containing protein [Oleiphilus messinensis]ARU58067.1 hypothetical protein OLMES_4049 [Oleiphilus messinensis]